MRRRDMIWGSLMATLFTSLRFQSARLSLASLSENDYSPSLTVRVGAPIPVSKSEGDTWTPTRAENGHLYSPSDDTTGFHSAPKANIAFNRIDGTDRSISVAGRSIRCCPTAKKARGADGCTWKSSGCACIDGVLYWVIARIDTAMKAAIFIGARLHRTPASSRARTTGGHGRDRQI